MTTRVPALGAGFVAGLLLTLVPASARGDDMKSPAATKALLARMDAAHADALAIRDPERPERFIAALRVPGQLLVVSATHPSVDLVAARLGRGEFRNIYMDLQGTPAQDSKFFVQDLDADGIDLDGRGSAHDIIHDGADSLACDGRWKDAKLKEDEYRQRIAEADARYARMLTLLAAAPTSGPPR